MTTTLDVSFLRAVVLMTGFRGHAMKSTQAALLLIGLQGVDFLASDLPAEITNGSRHLAGAVTGALITQGLLVPVGRIKSPRPEAKGRRLDILRIPADRVSTARAWLRANGYELQQEAQMSLAV